MLSRILLRTPESPDDSESSEEECRPSAYVVAKIGGRDALPDQHCLVQAALTYNHLVRSKEGDLVNLSHRVLAQASKDSKGGDWTAFVYSADHDAKDLRFVCHEDALSYHVNCSRLRREVEQKRQEFEQKLRELRAIPMPLGERIGISFS